MFFKVALFDLDGTLYDYEAANNYAITETLNMIINNKLSKNNITYKILKDVYNNARKNVHNNLGETASSHNRLLYFHHMIRDNTIGINITDILKINDFYWTTFYNYITPYKNVVNYIECLKKWGVKIGIITDFLTSYQYKKLEKLGLLYLIDEIITSEEVGKEKPSPQMFLTALNIFNVKSEDVIMFGDNLEKDCYGAMNCNINAFYFNLNQPQNQDTLNNSITSLFKLKNYNNYNNYNELLINFNTIYNSISELTILCKFFGQRIDLTQAGGGNISIKCDFFKNKLLIIKSSGLCLSDVNINNGYTFLQNTQINQEINILMNTLNKTKKEYDTECEKIVQSNIILTTNKKPSIETPMHTFFSHKYVIHLHPIQCNMILIKNDVSILKELFPLSLIIDYYTPGFSLSKEIIDKYKGEQIIFLKNHGLIIVSDSYNEIYLLIDRVINTIEQYLKIKDDFQKYKMSTKISEMVNLITNTDNSYITILSEDSIIECYVKTNIKLFDVLPTIPDQLVYCGTCAVHLQLNDNDRFLNESSNFVNSSNNFPAKIVADLPVAFQNRPNIEININIINDHINKYNEIPIIFIYDTNVYITSNSIIKCKQIEEVLKSHLMCLQNSDNNNSLNTNEINYLKNWDAEKYRKKIVL
jgi:putative hydrolase of the HAD superfamily